MEPLIKERNPETKYTFTKFDEHLFYFDSEYETITVGGSSDSFYMCIVFPVMTWKQIAENFDTKNMFYFNYRPKDKYFID